MTNRILPPYQVETPQYVPGMSVSVMPMSSKHANWMNDYEYFDQLGRDPLQQRRIWGITDSSTQLESVKEVLEDFPKQMHRRRILMKAAKRGDENIVRCLVEAGTRVQPDFEKAKEDKERDEHEDDDADTISLPDKENETCVPAFVAVSHGRLGCVKIFIESGVEVDARDEFGRTLLIAAAGSNQLDISSNYSLKVPIL